MTVATLPLDQILQRIAQQEAELQALRQEHTARQKQLDGLNRRQQELQAQLQQVEEQIRGLTGAGTVPAVPPTPPDAQAKLATKPRQETANLPAEAEQPTS